ncbi:MAG: hypothetical protein Q9214_002455 [Letrouitia sp. 1 TL-2023]
MAHTSESEWEWEWEGMAMEERKQDHLPRSSLWFLEGEKAVSSEQRTLTLEKALLLVKTFAKAPHLFHSPAKRKRHRESSSEISYPNKKVQEQLNEYGEVWRLTPSSFLAHWGPEHNDVIVKLYVAVERIDKSNITSKLARRVLCVALTELHNNIDDLVSRVYSSKELGSRDKNDIRNKFYTIFKAGAKWKHIIAICARITTLDRHENGSDRAFSGILWLLGRGNAWERASEDYCTKTVTDLAEQTDLVAQSRKYSPVVNAVLDYLKADISFNSQSYYSPTREPVQPARVRASETFLTPDGSMGGPVAPANRSIELLWRGSTHQKRWSPLGEATGTDAFETCLDRDLGTVCSDHSGLHQMFQKLEAAHVILVDSSTGMTALDQQVVSRVTDGLPRIIKTFWTHQALLIAIHGFPRKYLEPKYRQLAKLHLPHLQHTLKESGDCEKFKSLSNTARADLILSLVEASRFSDAKWKCHAIAMAKRALQQVNDSYLQACVAQRDCAVGRICGDTERSTLTLSSFAIEDYPHNVDPRMNAELGHLTLQSAINHVPDEELAKAIEELRSWQPLNATSPSTAERIASYHIDLWLGRVFRYQGQFSDSLECLQRSLLKTNHEGLFEDVRPQLICDLGDVYCELGHPLKAEYLLEAEMKRLDDRGKRNSTDWYLLQLSQAESLWGQGRLEEAEALCSGIQSFPRLSKLSKLRLFTLFGRISYARGDWSNSRHYWTKALSILSTYPLVNGHTSRVILYSMKEVLQQEGNLEWSAKYNDQFKEMKEIKSGGCEYWIPGLGKWFHNLTRPSERL